MPDVPYTDLVFDPEVYPRERVDDAHVEHLRHVLEAGGKLPRIVVEEETNVVVDGTHRAKAHLAHRGPGALIPAELHRYKTRQELLLDAIGRNADHGRPFTNADRTRAARLAAVAGVTVERVAGVLGLSTDRVQRLSETRPTVASAGSVTGRVRSQRLARTLGGYGDESGPFGLAEINQLVEGLRSRRIDIANRQIGSSLRALIKIGLELIRDSQAGTPA